MCPTYTGRSQRTKRAIVPRAVHLRTFQDGAAWTHPVMAPPQPPESPNAPMRRCAIILVVPTAPAPEPPLATMFHVKHDIISISTTKKVGRHIRLNGGAQRHPPVLTTPREPSRVCSN